MRYIIILATTYTFAMFTACDSAKKQKERTDEVKEEAVLESESTKLEEEEVSLDEFLTAINENNLTKVKKLIEMGVDVNAKPNWNSKTPLILAIESENLEIVKSLVKSGAEIDLGTGEFLAHTNPVKSAISHGQLEILKYLVSEGADINYWKPVWYIDIKNKEMLDYLMANDMDLNAKTEIDAGYSVSRLAFALQNEDEDMLNFLIGNGAIIDQSTLFMLESEDQFKMLQKAGYDFSMEIEQIAEVNGDASISSIFTNKSMKVISLFLEQGLIPNHNTLTTLFDQEAKLNLVLTHLQKPESEFDLNADFVFHRFVSYSPTLSSVVPDLETKLLSVAVIAQKPIAVKALVHQGANPNLKDKHGFTAVDYAGDNNDLMVLLDKNVEK